MIAALNTRPQSIAVWNRPFKTNFKGFFADITHAVSHGRKIHCCDLIDDATEALRTSGLSSEPAFLAWALIRNALLKSILEIINEHSYLLNWERQQTGIKLSDSLDFSFEKNNFAVKASFLKYPLEIPLLKDITNVLKQWVSIHGVVEAKAKTIASRLPSYFVYSLYEGWRDNAEFYSPLKKALRNRFAEPKGKAMGWIIHAAWLNKLVDKSVFKETFSLRQIYVPLRGCYEKSPKNANGEGTADVISIYGKSKNRIQYVCDLEKELKEWIACKDYSQTIRVLTGSPGCGKSSFAKMFAADIAKSHNTSVLYIPLHQLTYDNNMVRSVGLFVQQAHQFVFNPLNFVGTRKPLLIIFDELDDLRIDGKEGIELGSKFIDQVNTQVKSLNRNGYQIRILFTAQLWTVKLLEKKLHNLTKILYVLPFYVPFKDRIKFLDPHGIINQDQIRRWLRNYSEATGTAYGALKKKLRRRVLGEWISQPLTCYLAASTLKVGVTKHFPKIN